MEYEDEKTDIERRKEIEEREEGERWEDCKHIYRRKGKVWVILFWQITRTKGWKRGEHSG